MHRRVFFPIGGWDKVIQGLFVFWPPSSAHCSHPDSTGKERGIIFFPACSDRFSSRWHDISGAITRKKFRMIRLNQCGKTSTGGANSERFCTAAASKLCPPWHHHLEITKFYDRRHKCDKIARKTHDSEGGREIKGGAGGFDRSGAGLWQNWGSMQSDEVKWRRAACQQTDSWSRRSPLLHLPWREGDTLTFLLAPRTQRISLKVHHSGC